MKHMPPHRHVAPQSSARVSEFARLAPGGCPGRLAAIPASILPIATADATSASGGPSLKATLAEAGKLSQQIDILGQQYDSLRIQLRQAKANVIIARESAARDLRVLARDQSAVGAIAVEGYMTEGMNPALQLLQRFSPQSLLNRASIMTQIEQENGAKLKLVQDAATAAARAREAAIRSSSGQRSCPRNWRQGRRHPEKESFFNSQAYKQAEGIFQRTGQYPNIKFPAANSIGVQALRCALTRRGDPYVWGAAGPDAFDCSGPGRLGLRPGRHQPHALHRRPVERGRAHLAERAPARGPGVLLPRHRARRPYIGNGLMVDAPTSARSVQVQPMSDFTPYYDGAVRIIG